MELEASEEKELRKVVDEHRGMISKKMANGIIQQRKKEERPSKARVSEILSGMLSDGSIISMEEQVYRIFNKKSFTASGRDRMRRSIVLGDESANIPVTLWDKHAEMIDNLLIERGDRILADKLKLKKSEYGYELSTLSNTYLARLQASKNAVSDFSQLKPGERNIDIAGKVTSVGNIRHFNDLKGRESSVSDATLSDGRNEVRLVMWGSSSMYAGALHPGDLIKIEFAIVKETNQGIEISANDSSRILVKSSQEPRKA
jgi:ssDNA-binding replication factor A large subunit